MIERRRFLTGIVKFLSALIGVAFAAPVFSFIRSTFQSAGAEASIPIGSMDRLQEGINRVSFTRLLRDGWMVRTVEEYVWVRKKADGGVTVFEPHCTHLGCAYNWDAKSQRFLCPCHGGKFDKDGNHVAGPPPRNLDRFEVDVRGNQIHIGKVLKA